MDTLPMAPDPVWGAAWALVTERGLCPVDRPVPLEAAHAVLEDGKLGVILVAGNSAASFDELTRQVDDLYAWVKSGDRPKTWDSVVLFYVFAHGCPQAVQDHLVQLDRVPFSGCSLRVGLYDVPARRCRYASAPSLQTDRARPLLDAAGRGADRNDMDEAAYTESARGKQEEITNVLTELNARPTPGTWLLVAVCLLLFAITTIAGGSDSLPVLVRFGANVAPKTLSGEWFRLWGSTFLHIGVVHLIVNLFSLFSVGPTLERLIGTRLFMALYAFAGLTGSLASTAWHQQKPVVAAGASGALFGIFGAVAWVVYSRRDELPEAVRKRLAGGMLPAIGYNLLYGATTAGIDNAAHVGGLIGGTLFAVALTTPLAGRLRALPAATALVVALGALPFVNEAWVMVYAVRHASVYGAPTVTWRDPSGQLAFEHSDMLEADKVDLEGARVAVRLAGNGILMIIGLYPGEAGFDPRHPEAVLKELESALKVDRHDVVRVGDRDWLMAYGTSKEKKAAFAAAGNSKSLVSFFVVASDAQYADALKEMMRIAESLRSD